MSLGYRGFLPCQSTSFTTYDDYRHGFKPAAYRLDDGEVHQVSKCWKDQRGKGRSKRSTQYRPIAA